MGDGEEVGAGRRPPFVRRIERETGLPGLFDALASGLAHSDLQSLLLEVARARAAAATPAQILDDANSRPLLQPSNVDARLLHTFDRAAFAAAEGFEAIDLGPVTPLGTATALGGIDANSLLTTTRRAEVLGDNTPALALVAALRRRTSREGVLRLCSSHRVVRMQPIDFPGFTPHFRLFGMISAGRDRGSSAFEREELRRHIGFYLRLFDRLNRDGFHLRAPRVEISDLSITRIVLERHPGAIDQVRAEVRAHRPGASRSLIDRLGLDLSAATRDEKLNGLRSSLAEVFPEAEVRIDADRLEGFHYYPGLCFRILPQAPDGEHYPVADGGFTDWTARLLNDRKERLLTSGIGSEFVCRRYLAE